MRDEPTMRQQMHWLRRDLVAPLAALALTTAPPLRDTAFAAVAPAAFDASKPADVVTDRVFLDIRIIQSYSVEVLEDAAVRGRLSIDLFGKSAPLGVKKFLEFVDGDAGQFKRTGGGPAYAASSFDKLRPYVQIQGGKIAGLKTTTFAGQQEYEYLGRLLSLRPVIEVNDVKHDRRGLLTRPIFAPGPEFGVTLAPAPTLDGSNEVIGQLSTQDASNELLLAALESLPFITGKSLEGEGTPENALFQAQKNFFTTIAKTTGDTRAEDRTGALLRRVEITRCGRL